MGIRFRKSFGKGPIRVTISKSGVSTSVGVKGARITRRADGKTQTTVGIPGTGISYTSGSSERRSPANDTGVSRATWSEAVSEPQTTGGYDAAMPMGSADPAEKQGCLWAIIGACVLGLLGALLASAI